MLIHSLPGLRRFAMAISVAAVLLAVLGIGGLRANSHYTAYFDDNDARLVAHREIAALYSRHDSVVVVLRSPNSFLEFDNYTLLENLTAELTALRYTSRVLSLTELGIVGAAETADGYPIPTAQQLADDGRALGLLISEDSRTAAIVAQIELPDNAATTVVNSLAAVRALVSESIDGRSVDAHYTGTLALNEAYIDVVRRDLVTIFPLLLLLMILALRGLLRSWRAVLVTLPVGLCSIAAAFGIAGFFNTELAAIHTFVPVIVFSISLAGCVHMAISYGFYRAEGKSSPRAALASVNYNFLPLALANGTTMLGFLGLAFSPSPPIRVVGYLVAAGIAVSFALCLTLLPLLQARFDPWRPKDAADSPFFDWLRPAVARRATALIVVFALLALPAAWFATRNVVSDNVLEYFSSSHSFVVDTSIASEELSGVNEVLYSLETGDPFGLFKADNIESLDKLARWLRQQPEVVRVVSVSDAAAVQEAMLEGRLQGRLDFYRERLNSSSGVNPMLTLSVSEDFSSAAVSVYLGPLSSSQLTQFDEATHSWSKQHLGNGLMLRGGGPAMMFAALGEQNIRSMLVAFSVALIVAALVLGTVLRSRRIAFAGLICNLLPVLLIYSLWAVANGKISIGAAVVMGMILGIVIDDTIYFLTTYSRGVKAAFGDPVGHMLYRVGPAVIATTVTLVAGLSVGLLSDFGPIWSMSVLSMGVILAALLVDLLLLPALLSRPKILWWRA